MVKYPKARAYLKQFEYNKIHCEVIDLMLQSEKDGYILKNKAEILADRDNTIMNSQQIQNFIINLDVNDKIKKALYLKFICLKKNSEIAKDLFYSPCYVKTIISKGLSVANEVLTQKGSNLAWKKVQIFYKKVQILKKFFSNIKKPINPYTISFSAWCSFGKRFKKKYWNKTT